MEKINIAELLNNCPSGMELDCTCADNVIFDKIIEYEQIKCVIGECREPLILDKYGRLLHICCPKCVIFPKGKTTWKGFQKPFKDGDILTSDKSPFIYKNCDTTGLVSSYCAMDVKGNFWKSSDKWTRLDKVTFATEEDKQKLFKAIKDNGYRWNEETKTLEKLPDPKFNIGDEIVATKSGLQRAKSNTSGYCYLEYDFEFNEFFDADEWNFDRFVIKKEKQKTSQIAQ